MTPAGWGVLALIAAVITVGLGLVGRERRWVRLLIYFVGSFGGALLAHKTVEQIRWQDVLLIPASLGALVAGLLVQGLTLRLTRERRPRNKV